MISGTNITGVWVDEENFIADSNLGRAQELYLAYMNEFSAVTGDREAVGVIRERLRADADFWELADQIVEITEGKNDWINSIFRAEGRRAKREYAGKMEEIRQERLRKAEEEKRREQEELASMPTFGMF